MVDANRFGYFAALATPPTLSQESAQTSTSAPRARTSAAPSSSAKIDKADTYATVP